MMTTKELTDWLEQNLPESVKHSVQFHPCHSLTRESSDDPYQQVFNVTFTTDLEVA
mgnify:FL=1|tara:strand:- start:235 stop:402 length:168 start_codon:yes stop_codon:yes gene_type:complete